MPDGSTFPKNSDDFSVTTEELIADIANANNTAATVAEANGDHRSNIKAILDKRGYHKKAFADFRSMQAMSDSKFGDYWRTFSACYEAYRPVAKERISDLVDRAEKANSELEKDLQ